MDELNTNQNPVLTDAAIEEVLPAADEMVLENNPLSETEVEAEVGGDAPVEGEQNLNNEDEEAEKQEPAI